MRSSFLQVACKVSVLLVSFIVHLVCAFVATNQTESNVTQLAPVVSSNSTFPYSVISESIDSEDSYNAEYPFQMDYYEETQSDDGDGEIDEDSDFMEKARWSYALAFVEKMCREKCRENDKPFGRLLGTRCQCLCPLNARDLGLCDQSGACDKFCSSLGYYKGGDCVYNGVCFCYCKKDDKYDVNKVYNATPT